MRYPKSLYRHLCIDDLGFLNIILCLHRNFFISILRNCLCWRFNTQIEYTPLRGEEEAQNAYFILVDQGCH